MEDRFCTKCGYTGADKSQPKGSFFAELGLWAFGVLLAVAAHPVLLIIPLIYSIWRAVSRERVCPSCLQPGMISQHSPIAAKMLNELKKPE